MDEDRATLVKHIQAGASPVFLLGAVIAYGQKYATGEAKELFDAVDEVTNAKLNIRLPPGWKKLLPHPPQVLDYWIK